MNEKMDVRQGMEQEYLEFVEINSHDGYSQGIIDYMTRWANLMEAELAKGSTVATAAAQTEHIADTDGITGYMYGCAVQGLAKFWTYGDKLLQWHNQSYGYNGDGVVNPAIMTVSSIEQSEPNEVDQPDESPSLSQY